MTPQETIAQVLVQHRGYIRPVRGNVGYACVYCLGCGHEFASHTEYNAHVSQVITEAFGLRQEWGVITDMGVTSLAAVTEKTAKGLAERHADMTARSRWVTDWKLE